MYCGSVIKNFLVLYSFRKPTCDPLTNSLIPFWHGLKSGSPTPLRRGEGGGGEGGEGEGGVGEGEGGGGEGGEGNGSEGMRCSCTCTQRVECAQKAK